MIMKTIVTNLVVLCVLGALSNSARAADHGQAIKARVATFVDAWNQHDAKQMAACWTEDGDLINPFGVSAKGREQIEQLFAKEQSQIMKNTTNEMSVASIRMVGDDLALVD